MYAPETYKRRLIDNKIDLYLRASGAINIIGMRWTGKTTTGQAHCKSEISLADSSNNFSNRRLAQASPDFALKGETPRLIDEWQEVPAIWDATRFACDSSPENGLYILTGSSSINFSKDEIFHSGAGRITKIELGSMTLFETGDSSGLVSLQDLFDKPLETMPTGKIQIEDLLRYCVRGGWPKNTDAPVDVARVTPAEYVKSIIEKDFNNLPNVKNKRSVEKITAALGTVARFDSTTSGTTEFSAAIKTNYGIAISRQSFEFYLEGFRQLFIIDYQKAFPIVTNTGSKLLKSPKIRFADPSLVVATLGYKPEMLLNDMDMFSHVFDLLCYHDLKIYAESIDAEIYHLMEEHGNSVDSIIQLSDGRIGLFKHILSGNQLDDAASELLKMNRMLSNVGREPSLLCIVCGMIDAAYTRPDGIRVVPITSLKP